MQYTVLLAVTRTGLQARAAICSALQVARQREGRAVVFDKTGIGFVHGIARSLGDPDEIEIVERPVSEYLYATIYGWGCNQVSSGSSWIQIMSDDDSQLLRAEAHPEENPSHSMYVCPTLFLYENDALLEDDKRFCFRGRFGAQLPSIRGQLPGDTAWHGLVRDDVFIGHSKWMKSVPIELASFSNLIFWSALVHGKVGRMRNFAMIKDCVDGDAQAVKAKAFHTSLGLPDDPPGRIDSLAYWPTVMALLLDQRKNQHDLRLETCISSAGGNLYRIGLGMGLRSGGFRTLREVDVHELRRAGTTASIALTRKSIFRTVVRVQFAVVGSGNTKAYKLRRLNDKYLIPLAMESLKEFPEELRPLRERLSASFSKWI